MARANASTHPWKNADRPSDTTAAAKRDQATALCVYCEATALYRVKDKGFCKFHYGAAKQARAQLNEGFRRRTRFYAGREKLSDWKS